MILTTTGCTTTAAYKPSTIQIAQVPPENQFPGKLLIYTTTQDDEFIYEGAGKSMTSMGHSMRVPFGKIVKLLAGDVYGKLFNMGHDFGGTISRGTSYDMIVHPKAAEFEYRFNQAKNAGMAITTQVNMSLQLEVLDAAGKKLFERTYESGWVDGATYVASFSPGEFVTDLINRTLVQLMIRSVPDLLSSVQRKKPNVGKSPESKLSEPESERASGTGFFITEDGYLLTNAHVVAGSRRVKIRLGTEAIDATIVRTDSANDLALLKVSGTHKALALAPSHTVKLGASVFTIGFPNPSLQGFEPKLTDGVISALSGIQDAPTMFQISVPLQPGNSGGPLVDSNGRVVGIVNSSLADIRTLRTTGSLPQNVNYAIKSTYARALAESVPEISGKLESVPDRADKAQREEIVGVTQKSVVLIIVY